MRFAAYIQNVILSPIEIWASHAGRDYYNILGCLDAAGKQFFMNVVVEADSHICDTAYVVDRARRIENYRKEKPLLLAWALKI